jgi:hypothetical protein
MGEKGPPGKPLNRIGWSGDSASLGVMTRTAAQNIEAAAIIAVRAGHLALPAMLSGVPAVVMCAVRFKANGRN